MPTTRDETPDAAPHEPQWAPFVDPADRPQLGRSDAVLIGAYVVYGIFLTVLKPLEPSQLAHHVTLWEALYGSNWSIITGGALVRTGQASPVVVALCGLIGTVNFDLLFWWLGSRWGEFGITLLLRNRPRATRVMTRIQTWMGRWSVPLMLVSHLPFIPTALICVAAGWSGMSLRRYAVLAVLGGLVRVGALAAVGYAVGHPAVAVTKEIARYGLWLGIGIAVLIVGRMMWSAHRLERRQAAARGGSHAGVH